MDGRCSTPTRRPALEGTLTCPSVEGATNFFSTAYNPVTGLFYVNTLETVQRLHKNTDGGLAGRPRIFRRRRRRAPDDKAQKILRAFDIQTGKAVWELPQDGQGETWGGVMSTASGLVFYGDDGGELAVADATTGKKLWSFPFTESLHTSPMTYMFDNQQYVGMVVGSVVYVFGLGE